MKEVSGYENSNINGQRKCYDDSAGTGAWDIPSTITGN